MSWRDSIARLDVDGDWLWVSTVGGDRIPYYGPFKRTGLLTVWRGRLWSSAAHITTVRRRLRRRTRRRL